MRAFDSHSRQHWFVVDTLRPSQQQGLDNHVDGIHVNTAPRVVLWWNMLLPMPRKTTITHHGSEATLDMTTRPLFAPPLFLPDTLNRTISCVVDVKFSSWVSPMLEARHHRQAA